jgi:ArsR family transcriptional regulator
MPDGKVLDSLSDACDTVHQHEQAKDHLGEKHIEEGEVAELAELFKALSDPTRLKIVQALKNNELCVCHLSSLLKMHQSAISHQLRYLRNLRLVKRRKEGKMMYYSIGDEHIETLLSQGLEHISHQYHSEMSMTAKKQH